MCYFRLNICSNKIFECFSSKNASLAEILGKTLEKSKNPPKLKAICATALCHLEIKKNHLEFLYEILTDSDSGQKSNGQSKNMKESTIKNHRESGL